MLMLGNLPNGSSESVAENRPARSGPHAGQVGETGQMSIRFRMTRELVRLKPAAPWYTLAGLLLAMPMCWGCRDTRRDPGAQQQVGENNAGETAVERAIEGQTPASSAKIPLRVLVCVALRHGKRNTLLGISIRSATQRHARADSIVARAGVDELLALARHVSTRRTV